MYRVYGNSKIGKGSWIGKNVIIGYPGKDEIKKLINKNFKGVAGAKIGENCIIRDYGVIYSHATLGNNVKTGHHFIVREHASVGNDTLIGSGVIIEDRCKIGSNVSIQSNVYISTNTVVENDVFIGPNAVLINDRYMGRGKAKLVGPWVEKNARIGANSTILPKIRIGKDSLIGAGAVVTKNVKPYDIVAGVPAKKIGEVSRENRL